MGQCQAEITCCSGGQENETEIQKQVFGIDPERIESARGFNRLTNSQRKTLLSGGPNGGLLAARAIVKIQSVFRGRLVRMRLEKIRYMLAQREEVGGSFDSSIKDIDFFFNARVKEVYEREGPFDVQKTYSTGPDIIQGSIELVDKEPYRMQSGVIY